MRIIRIENSERVGMYHVDRRSACDIIKNDSTIHPMADQDSALMADIKKKTSLLSPEYNSLQQKYENLDLEWRKAYRENNEEFHELRNERNSVRDLMNEIYNEINYKFCFGSVAQFDAWLYNHKWRNALAESEFGLRMSIYEVPELYVMVGGAQCTFHKDHAVLVHSLPVNADQFSIKLAMGE